MNRTNEFDNSEVIEVIAYSKIFRLSQVKNSRAAITFQAEVLKHLEEITFGTSGSGRGVLVGIEVLSPVVN